MPGKKNSTPTPITSHKHADKRANIPTEELRDFIAEEENAPKNMLYPRDPSLDPQLVWKGKDEQDAEDLEVPVVPIYIQEHIKPQAIIENVRANAEDDQPQQMGLFADFNGLTFEERVDFYHHEQNWTNRMILGDSLLVMTSLAEKEGLKGKVQMIYLDPPYGIKFGSNWQVSTRKRDVKDGKAEDATRQPEQVKAFRDTWEMGIHSYLSYLRDRLVVARELLTESGSFFMQIGDENVHLVRSIMDEVFGSENFVVSIMFMTTSGFETNELSRAGDYLLWYAKNKNSGIKYRKLFRELERNIGDSSYRWIRFADGTNRGLTASETRGEEEMPGDIKRYSPDSITSSNPSRENQIFLHNGKKYHPGANSHWKAQFPEGMKRLALSNRLHVASNSLRYMRMTDDFPWAAYNNIWTDTLTGQFTDDKIYVVQTNTKVIERCMLMSTDPGDLVLDPTCGSGTTAYVAEQWGRRWITVDTSRVSIALARTRLMAGRFPYYLLADSYEGKKKERELEGKFMEDKEETLRSTQSDTSGNDLKRGFVYQRVPHVTLKAIANNEEIDVIHEKFQGQLEELRVKINKAAGKRWEEWEVPRQIHEGHPSEVSGLLSEYWNLRQIRQKEMDASIARRADTEYLYDQPYEENKRLRVAGPFTVESLSPHRVLDLDADGRGVDTHDGFENMILENLKKAGVQNTFKNERLKFDRLESYAGTWIHASGEYTDKDGSVHRAAITIGPEHGTVGPDIVKEAAKEATRGVGFDLLIVCGFAFDPHVSEEAKRYGKLTVLPARMNPDLAMGDALLKKTGAGNLFMVFGEPDLEIIKAGGKIIIQLKGLDVYDPTTGEIRSNSTDDIACWFIDTDYNEETFIVRHAYFTGADQPYDKLKRALRAEIDESAWEALYSTTSYPFEPSKTGKIAVKVINHYGDEVLKVYEVG